MFGCGRALRPGKNGLGAKRCESVKEQVRLPPQAPKLYPSHRAGISDVEMLRNLSGRRSSFSLIFTVGSNCSHHESDEKYNYLVCPQLLSVQGETENFCSLAVLKLKTVFIFQHSPKTN